MSLVIPDDLHPALVPLAWLIGRWEGTGVLGYAGVDGAPFRQSVEFRHDGRDFLHYSSQLHLLDVAGDPAAPIDSETGYWRVSVPLDMPLDPPLDVPLDPSLDPPLDSPPGPRAPRRPSGVDVEVLLAHPTGVVEVYVGHATGARVELATDVVARTRTAEVYTAARRLYGSVEGQLMWALDVAAGGHAMSSYASAALQRA